MFSVVFLFREYACHHQHRAHHHQNHNRPPELSGLGQARLVGLLRDGGVVRLVGLLRDGGDVGLTRLVGNIGVIGRD